MCSVLYSISVWAQSQSLGGWDWPLSISVSSSRLLSGNPLNDVLSTCHRFTGCPSTKAPINIAPCEITTAPISHPHLGFCPGSGKVIQQVRIAIFKASRQDTKHAEKGCQHLGVWRTLISPSQSTNSLSSSLPPRAVEVKHIYTGTNAFPSLPKYRDYSRNLIISASVPKPLSVIQNLWKGGLHTGPCENLPVEFSWSLGFICIAVDVRMQSFFNVFF